MNDKIQIIDLKSTMSVLTGKFPDIETVHIFGSRRYNTDSIRSDVDLLVTTSKRIKPSDLRDFIIEFNTALDIFILENGQATSIANDSFITASTTDELIKDLDALILFDRSTGNTENLNKYNSLQIDRRVKHEMTTLPNASSDVYEVKALIKYFETAKRHGLPARPYIGLDTNEASDFIIQVMRNIITANSQISARGNAKGKWTMNLKDEYDFQNLFWITSKPWIPGIGREEVELKYDGNEKRSDFNLFKNQLVIELKHIKDDNDKRSIVKTLSGLKDFYLQHPNIKILIFGILVNNDVKLDDRKWENDFSYENEETNVKTVIIRNTLPNSGSSQIPGIEEKV